MQKRPAILVMLMFLLCFPGDSNGTSDQRIQSLMNTMYRIQEQSRRRIESIQKTTFLLFLKKRLYLKEIRHLSHANDLTTFDTAGLHPRIEKNMILIQQIEPYLARLLIRLDALIKLVNDGHYLIEEARDILQITSFFPHDTHDPLIQNMKQALEQFEKLTSRPLISQPSEPAPTPKAIWETAIRMN